tara:strand:- start:1822 stop:3771 length:1950 start_codon:yes stop_codon:yes gene_type:complete
MDIEAAIFALILGAALWPLMMRVFPTRGWLLGSVLALFCVAVSISAALFATGTREFAIPESEIVDRPIEVPGEGYVTSDTCRSCHPGEYNTWHQSYHRSMTQVPTPENVLGDFDDKVVELYGHSYHLQRRGDEFWVELDYLSPLLDQQKNYTRVWRKIVLMTGSHHMQVYWMSHAKSKRLEMLPVVYLFEADRWVPRASVFLQSDTEEYHGELGRWNDTCIDCHTTRPQPGKHDDFDLDSQAAEFGIACEACHGPAHKHITANRSFPRRYKLALSDANDETIFHPKQVSEKQSSQVCGRCHGVTQIKKRDYNPFHDLSEFRTPLTKSDEQLWAKAGKELGQDFLDNSYWPDGMIRVRGREFNALINNPCYNHGDKSKRVMSCMSCHVLHQRPEDKRDPLEWADDQLKPGMRTDLACTQCHEDFLDDKRIAAHTHHPVGSSGSACYNCHMPFTTYGLLQSMRSHTVTSPSIASTLETGRPNACNLCHLDKTMTWAAKHLDDWWGIRSPAITEEPNLAASVDWLLRGDAAQRAMLAWAMGWDSAREVSGTDWMTPHLARLLDDPYDAIRFIARRSLMKQPGFSDFEYDFVASADDRKQGVLRALDLWRKQPSAEELKDRLSVLFDENGQLQQERADRLAAQRNDRVVRLAE